MIFEQIVDNVCPLVVVRIALITLIVCLLCKLYFTGSRLPLPPGPYGIPILGYLPFVGHDFHLRLTELGKKYGSIYQIHLGTKRVVVINDARLIKEAFRQQVFSGRPDTELTRILQGYGKLLICIQPIIFHSFYTHTHTHTGIVNTDGALWKEQRAFLHSVLRKLGAKSMILGRDCLELKIRVSAKCSLVIGIEISLLSLTSLKCRYSSMISKVRFAINSRR